MPPIANPVGNRGTLEYTGGRRVIPQVPNWPANRQPRRGAAFILLVAMILIVVATTTNMLIQGAVTSRWNEREKLQDTILLNAISAADALESGESIELTIAPESNERFTVQRIDNQRNATWRRGDTVIDQMNRPLASSPNSASGTGE